MKTQPTRPPSKRAAALRETYEANLSHAALWAHPSWYMAILGVDESIVEQWRHTLAHTSKDALHVCSRALAEAAHVIHPDPDAYQRPALETSANSPARLNLALLSMLPTAVGLQVLCMRALLFRRIELRRTIDKRVWARLSEWAGVHIETLIADAPPMDTLETDRGLHLPIDALDAQALANEGFVLFMRDGCHDGLSYRHLLQLALKHGGHDGGAPAFMPGKTDANGSAWLYSQLPNWLGTWSWLFG
ncbi:type III secretion protein HrpB4 [Burkholderia singularis]|uniref:Type III secretion protein n=1 Tax=Burkholderia singularis TaxID=1503053 RepID=A0A238H4A1_9BURK|nr:type III secretion protein HrpB4 [Burkholderia singularis]SMF99967.1 hypothetical protein BSIN_3156 [Burkholderia singularis]